MDKVHLGILNPPCYVIVNNKWNKTFDIVGETKRFTCFCSSFFIHQNKYLILFLIIRFANPIHGEHHEMMCVWQIPFLKHLFSLKVKKGTLTEPCETCHLSIAHRLQRLSTRSEAIKLEGLLMMRKQFPTQFHFYGTGNLYFSRHESAKKTFLSLFFV